MAVLIEGISVITRADTLQAKFPGGWEQYERSAPNGTLCADGEIARIGFMMPADVERFIYTLQQCGFEYMRDGTAIDIAVADQIHGLLSTCSWLQFGRVPLSGTEHRVAACRLTGGSSKSLVMPPDWRFETSLSAKSTFVANGNLKSQVQYLRTRGNLDVYRNIETGEEMFVGRTAKP
jgi:hypothetical protein